MISDAELLRGYACQGQDSAFVELLGRHAGWLAAAARRRMGDDDLADDAVQTVFVVLAEKAAQLVAREHLPIRAWLFHVMHLTCCRLRRSQSRHIGTNGRRECCGRSLIKPASCRATI
jgi:DNA-directed RNA polymerase specialized sigma24 family protein